MTRNATFALWLVMMLVIVAFDVILFGWGLTLLLVGASFLIAWLWGRFWRKSP